MNVNQDNSDLRLTEQLANFSSLVSHELRTPLTSIRAVLGLLNNGYLGSLSEDGLRLLDIAIHNTDRLVRLANAIDRESSVAMAILSDADIEQLQLENDLHSALKNQEFRLYYQPIVSLETNKIIGFEALSRWQHPVKGLISPTKFIPLAEKTGLIHKLGLWSIEQACYQLHKWQQQFPNDPPLTMSVNFSTLQLIQPNLVEKIQSILQTVDIAPDSLKLEITESSLIENLQEAIAIFNQLQALGVQFYVDDFGTGYSALGRLKDLPIDALKIDRSFVLEKKWDISETILILAKKLGLDVIAEGVETLEDLAFIKALGCQKMQGYFFSKPVEQEIASMLIYQSLKGDENCDFPITTAI
ncbi:EAL domain-containing protein [Phormidium sp. LEGE 05292]|uniref:putative bifunctional diguanylate cyclase/phosphodiesterase n=1 Tax=[Phormidium] sp. LEGE 05292 TaxID=767427 RepID=UPI00187F2D1A|nr:EAL domain-containing protein [Phormidium sp. LEGE 05292]MBE9225466.1 EAL domain-containing protein [Phormidium sp. LEGE 05292]